MGIIDLSEVVEDPDLAEPFTIIRTSGQFGAGGWLADTPQNITAFGVVSVATPKEIADLPVEADKIKEVRAFWSTTPMFVTNAVGVAAGATSDVLVWQGVQYRVLALPDYSNRGYYKALAIRMAGN